MIKDMHIHEQVLAAARELGRGNDWVFGVDEVVRMLPHLNESSVRTHVVSRCCVNAPKNHPHKWDYFQRVDRGKYKVAPRYRVVKAEPPKRQGLGPSSHRRDTIHSVVQKDGSVYVAECLELAVVTQGDTLDELMVNLKDALALHLDGEDLARFGLTPQPRLQILYDTSLAS